MLVLTVISGPDKGKRFVVNEPQLIGRSSEALRTNDPTISRRHAELTPDDGKWFIRDLESSNGTFVNGSQIADRTEVTPGDHIRTGATLFVCGKTDPTPSDRGRIEVVQPEELDARVDKTRAAGDASVLLPSTDQEHAALAQLRVIYRLTQLTTQVFDQQSLLEKVMDLVFEEFKPDRGFILLFDTGKKGGQPAVVRHRTDNGGTDSEKISVSRTVIQHVIQEKEGVLSSKVAPAGDVRDGEPPTMRSAICVPIQFHNHVFGVIHIDVDIAGATYSEPQLALLTAIGQHSGLALQNAEMYRAQIQTERLAAVGETIASLSHSIKNILQGLRGGADVLEMGLKKEDFQLSRGGWDVLSRNLERIYTLTMNMLAFTKRTPLEVELTKPIPVLLDCIELIKPQCDRKGVKLTIEPDPDMPPIPMDPNAMHQALMNLLVNALQAVDPKTGRIALRTKFLPAQHEDKDGETKPARARIFVIDNGSGIPRDQLDQIFDAFYSTKGIRGTGLGLAVTQKIIEEHGGEIDVRSEEGRGASFMITLPATRATGVDPAETAAPGSLSRDSIQGF